MPRELIDTGSDKRFVRRNAAGQFDDVVDVGKSLGQDRQQRAKRVVKAGEGDRGDQAATVKTRKSASSSHSPVGRAKRART
jgi:hypothetical protein